MHVRNKDLWCWWPAKTLDANFVWLWTLSNCYFGTIAQLCRAVSSQLRHVLAIGKRNLLNSVTPSTCPHNVVDFGLLTAEICWRVWGTPANFNGLRVLAALLHGTLVVGVSQTLWSWTEGVTYIWQATITLGIGPHSSSDEVRLAGSLSDFVLYLFWKKTFRDKWLRFFTGSCHQPNSVHAPNETFTKLIYTY